MMVVSNTGPLIALAKVDKLLLLEQLFSIVYIPPAVHRELLAKPGPEAERLDLALATFVRVTERPVVSAAIEVVTAQLDHGEQEAVALASLFNALLLMDDRLGRRAARRLDVQLTGTAGLLIRAVELQLIPDAVAVLEEMRSAGYWLSDELLAAVRRTTQDSQG